MLREANNKARELFNEKKDITATELVDALEKFIRMDEIPSAKQAGRWIDDFKKEDRNEELSKDVLELGETVYRDKKERYTIQPNYQPPNLELIEPPSLVEDLIKTGIPEKNAPELLARWDIAYRMRDSYQTNICHKTTEIFKDEGWQGIEYERALSLGEYETKYIMFKLEGKEAIETLKRYKPWLSKERNKAYAKVFHHLVETVYKPRRKKSEEKLQRMFNSINTYVYKNDKS